MSTDTGYNGYKTDTWFAHQHVPGHYVAFQVVTHC